MPVLVIHSEADESVLIAQSQRFYDQLVAPKQFFALKTANHGITATADRQESVDVVHKWLQATERLRQQ